jgi:hypothetical protein
MQSSSAVYLAVPARISLGGTTFAASLCVPRTASALVICIQHPGQERDCADLAGHLAAAGLAALTIRAEHALSLSDMIALVDWVRSRRLLRSLRIGVIAHGAEGAIALKAAEHRPVAVPAVLVMRSNASSMPSALQWLRARLTSRPKTECRLAAAYSA